MRLLIDGKVLWRNTSGTERYITEIMNGMRSIPDTEVFMLASRGARYRTEMRSTVRPSDVAGFDVFHKPYPVQNSIELAELASARKSVLTVLDLILLRYPEIIGDDMKLERYRVNMALSLQITDRVIAISEHCKRDIIENFGTDPSKIDVSLLGASVNRFKPLDEYSRRIFKKRMGLPGRYVLCVNSDFPHKNMKNMLKGFADASERGVTGDCRLVWAGNSYHRSRDPEIESLKEKLGDRLVMLDYVPDSALPGIYAAAEAFVYPSLYEGFGLPILEAFAAGVPVLCSNSTSIPEVAGDGAFLVDASEPGAIADGLASLLGDGDLCASLVARGKARLGLFSWEKCVTEHRAVYEKAAFPSDPVLGMAKCACANLLTEIDPPVAKRAKRALFCFAFPVGSVRYRLAKSAKKAFKWKK